MKTGIQPRDLVRSILWAAVLCVPIAAGADLPAASAKQPSARAAEQIERGRYLVLIGGCNDCHTPGFGPSGGKVAEQDWLVGDTLGFSGPWGTTYPSNLRLLVAGMTEQQWLVRSQVPTRPPMPWPSLRVMRQEDLKAVYRYIASLGPKGQTAPAYLPPGKVPSGPVVAFPAAPGQ